MAVVVGVGVGDAGVPGVVVVVVVGGGVPIGGIVVGGVVDGCSAVVGILGVDETGFE